MTEIKFIKFNGIKEYARVMYNDVKDADKYRIDVAYNGRDVKDLLEYLFELEEEIERLNKSLEEQRHFYLEKLEEKENIIKEVREYISKVPTKKGTEAYRIGILGILDKENKE